MAAHAPQPEKNNSREKRSSCADKAVGVETETKRKRRKRGTPQDKQAALALIGMNPTANRSPQAFFLWLHLCCELTSRMGSTNNTADAALAEKRLRDLCDLRIDSTRDRTTILGAIREHAKENDWQSIETWRTEKGIDTPELAAKEWHGVLACLSKKRGRCVAKKEGTVAELMGEKGKSGARGRNATTSGSTVKKRERSPDRNGDSGPR